MPGCARKRAGVPADEVVVGLVWSASLILSGFGSEMREVDEEEAEALSWRLMCAAEGGGE